MRVGVERDRRAGEATSIIVDRADGAPIAAAWTGNLLREAPPEAWGTGVSRLLAWSGSLGEGLDDAHPATWLRPGHEALAAACSGLEPGLRAAGRRLCLRPHCRHVLSDHGSAAAFLRDRPDGPFEIALDPAALLEASMLADVEDHLRRSFESLGPVAAIVLLADVRPAAEEGAPLDRVPLGEGVLPLPHLRSLLAASVPAETPVVIGGDDVDGQLARLGAA